MAGGSASGPLCGVNVLEIATMVAGPLVGATLADLGASVTKVESTTGDPFQRVPPMHHGLSAHYFAMNWHKPSIALDLKSEDGRAITSRSASLALMGPVLIGLPMIR